MTECLSIESFDFPLDFQRSLTAWLADERADKLRVAVAHMIAERTVKAVNAHLHLDEMPNQTLEVAEVKERVRDLQIFLSVFDEIRRTANFQKVVVNVSNL